MVNQKISIRLLKENIKPSDVLKKDYPLASSSKTPPDSELYTENFQNNNVDWANYLGIQASTKGSRAVLFISVKKRWFALCFSGGHHMLDLNQCLDDFGLIVALNCLDPNEIKSSDVFMPSDHSKQKRTQTTRETNLEGHDFDGYTNILKNITGKSKKEYQHISKSITASSSISINTDKTPSEIDKLLEDLLSLYGKEDYKKSFPETTYIKAVKQKGIIDKLDLLLLKAIKTKSDNIYLIIPELVNFFDIAKYDYNFKRKGSRNHYDTVSIDDLYAEIDDQKITMSVEDLKKRELCLYDENDKAIDSYSLYNSLIFDCEADSNTYHFSHGKWFSVDKKFADGLNKEIEAYKKALPSPFKILEYDKPEHKNENGYNKALAEANTALLLDAKNIPITGYDKIEACDVLYKHEQDKNYFIHVKHKHSGSQGMAHLFAQGDTSLTLLRNQESNFVEGLAKLTNQNADEVIKINHSEVTVVFLIISKQKTPTMPLFTKIALSRILKSIKSKNASPIWEFVEFKKDNGE